MTERFLHTLITLRITIYDIDGRAEVKKPNDVPAVPEETEKPLKIILVLSKVDRMLLDRMGSYLLFTGVTKDRHYSTVCKWIIRTYVDSFSTGVYQTNMMREQMLKEKKELEERGKQILEMKARIKSEEERLNAEKAAKEAPKQ